ncbi:MAG: right-handed parallel beta-helix repeat-containing protein [Planctomycetota bacterium]
MVNVYGYGAAGDGKTDDTDALQHALESGDGVLRLNKGTYRITRPLVLDLTKQGYGGVRGESGASRIVMAGPGPALRIIGDHQGSALPRSVQPHTWDKERLPIVTAVEIVGEHPDAVGIELRRTLKCVVAQVLIRQCKHGIHLVERNRDFVLADSHLYDNHEIGLFFDQCNLHQIIVHGNHISWNKVAGIKSLDGDVHNLQIVGNDIEYNNITAGNSGPRQAAAAALAAHHGGAEIWFEARQGVISEVTISGNTIQATVQPGGANIRIVGATVARSSSAEDDPRSRPDTAHLINITGNVLGSQFRAVDLQHASRVTIAGNSIYDSADLSIRATHCRGLAIGSNTFGWRCADSEPPKDGLLFEDCDNIAVNGLAAERFCAGSPETGAAVTFRRCQDSSLSNSHILDPLHRGVELEDCVRCRVAHNTIVDRRPKPRMAEAIRVLGSSRDNIIAGNIVGGATGQAIQANPAAADVRDNRSAAVGG